MREYFGDEVRKLVRTIFESDHPDFLATGTSPTRKASAARDFERGYVRHSGRPRRAGLRMPRLRAPSPSLRKSLDRFLRLGRRVEPVLRKERSDVGLNNLSEPCLGRAGFQSVRRRNVAVSDPKLLAEAHVRRDRLVQRMYPLLDVRR